MGLGRTALKAFFETGDVPTEAEFALLIDAILNINDDDSDNITESTDKKFLDGSSEQLIAGAKEFSNHVYANNAANATKTFTATPTFDFDADGNDQQMTLSGNVTSFATSNEVGSANYDIWLINDGTAGRTVAAPTGWTEITGGDTHDDSANAINLYQFKTSPSGIIKRFIIKNM